MIQDNNFGVFGAKMNDIAAYHYLGIVKSGEMRLINVLSLSGNTSNSN